MKVLRTKRRKTELVLLVRGIEDPYPAGNPIIRSALKFVTRESVKEKASRFIGNVIGVGLGIIGRGIREADVRMRAPARQN